MDQKNNKLKIGILLRNRHDGPGGLEKVLDVLAQGMAKRDDVDLYFYSLYPLKYQTFTKSFQKIEYLQTAPFLEKVESFLPNKLGRLLHKWYVHQNGYRLFQKMMKDQLDVLITMDLSKQFLINYPFLKRFKEESGIPLLSWVHVSLTGSRESTAHKVKEKVALFDGHLAISQGLADELSDEYHAENIELIYNPVDAAEIVPRNIKKLIYIGRITKIKRVDSLIKELAQLQGDWHLDIYGSTGSESGDAQFKALISALNLEDKITFHGWQKDAWGMVKEAGVLLLNSTREGFGLVIVEAMQRGIPVIAADCPVGPAELIHNGVNGWLYPVDEEFRSREYLQKILDGELKLPSLESVQKSVTQFETGNYLNHFIGTIRQYQK